MIFVDYLKNLLTDLKTPNRKVVALEITFQMMLNLSPKSEEMIEIFLIENEGHDLVVHPVYRVSQK